MPLDILASATDHGAMTATRKRPKPREEGAAILKLLSRARISQRQLARDVQMDAGLMSRKVRGLRPWRLEDLVKISDALSTNLGYAVTIDALVGRR